MSSLDNSSDYKKIQDKVKATQSYGDLKNQYSKAKKQAGQSFEQADDKVKKSLNEAKDQTKKFQKEIKSQFEELLDLLKITGSGVKDKYDSIANKIPNSIPGNLNTNVGGNSNTIRYVKKILIKSLKNIEPKIIEILNQECLNAVGCDQQQTFTPQTIYIKVKSIDLANLLKIDPTSKAGKVLYEKLPVQVQIPPFSMNRELYHRIQTPTDSYDTEYGQKYYGKSGQDLFNIQYFDSHPITFESGGWFGVTLYNRYNNINKVGEFMIDYYRTIKLFEFQNIMANIMEQLSGAISINASIGIVQANDASKFQRILQRILGLCFDNVREIDVSGVAKIAELDGVDNSFFEFTSIDLREIDQRVTNIKNGVIQFEDCGNVSLPVDSQAILDALNNLLFVEGTAQEDDASDAVVNALTNNPDWAGFTIAGNIQASVDFNFVKLIVQGLVCSLLSPKVLLPIFIMLKSLGQNVTDLINSFMEFAKQFRTFLINTVSKIGALFVKELFELIKRDIKNLIQQVIMDVAKEKGDKRVIMILKLIQLLLVIAQFISDWRRCKSVIDELLWLLKIATTGWGGEIALPLLYASQMLDGYSESRAFLGTIEELQKIGVPTGALPDGSPNLEVLTKFSQMKAMANEDAENGKVQIAVGPLSITPAGMTVPASAFGKKM